MAKRKGGKIAAVVIIVVVGVAALGYFGYLPFLNSPHFGFPSSSQMSSASGNGNTYNQQGSPQSPSGNQGSGVVSAQELNFTSSMKASWIQVLEIQYSNDNDARNAYLNLTGQAGPVIFKSSGSGNLSYRGFTYAYVTATVLGLTISSSTGYDSNYLFFIYAFQGSASSISINACSQSVISSMYSV